MIHEQIFQKFHEAAGSLPGHAARLPELPPLVLGESVVMQRLMRLIERMAPSDRPILINGPTGAGKEIVARLIHQHSRHQQAPFVDVNCGAIPEHLVESELFGHVKGSFTGAVGHHQGHFQMVGQGTLFLDEVGELPLAMQAKLLRVLESRVFRPVGGSESRPFVGRIVAATHRDLPAMVAEGRFREDLFHRLAVFVLEVPGLDQRKEDIPHFVKLFIAAQPRQIEFAPAALKRLCLQRWPGNIRQLRNLIDRLGVLAESPLIDEAILAGFLEPAEEQAALRAQLADDLLLLPGRNKLEQAQDLLLDRALQLCQGNKSAAAKLLGVGRKTVERRLSTRAAASLAHEEQIAHCQRLVDASAYAEAIPLLRVCLHELQDAGSPQAQPRLLFEVYRLLGASLHAVSGWLCQEARECYQSALTIGRGCCETAELLKLQFGVWIAQLMSLELNPARATAQEMLTQAQLQGSEAALSEACFALANTLFWLGDGHEVLACLQRANLLSLTGHEPRLGLQGFDLSGLAMTFEGLAAFQLGKTAQAQQVMTQLMALAQVDNDHAFNRAILLQGATWLACLFEDQPRLLRLAIALEDISRTHQFPFYQGLGQFFHGVYLGRQGDWVSAERLMRDGYETYMQKHGGKLFHSFQAWQRGELLLQAGDLTACMVLVEHALDVALAQQERAYLGELLVLKARGHWAQGAVELAEQELRSALSMTQALGTMPARIAAAYHLALLLEHTGRLSQALEVLSRTLRGTESASLSPAYVRAAALLQELS